MATVGQEHGFAHSGNLRYNHVAEAFVAKKVAGNIAAAQASIAAGRILHANAALQLRHLWLGRHAGHRTRMEAGVGLLLSILFEEGRQKKRAAAAGVRRRQECGGGGMPKSHGRRHSIEGKKK